MAGKVVWQGQGKKFFFSTGLNTCLIKVRDQLLPKHVKGIDMAIRIRHPPRRRLLATP
jgi:hypothetical protein